jgi:tRNA (guanine-N7-)-methyltransferase
MPAGTTEDVAAPPLDLEILPGQVDGRLHCAALFGRAGRVELEIGFGKGRFLLREAERRPDVDFLGLEWSLKHLRLAKERAVRHRLRNLRVHRADARHVVQELVADATFERVHIYCPDPWPKKRHHKRRLFTSGTSRHLERILVPGGYLNVSTDVREYFDAIVATVESETGLRRAADPLYPAETREGNTSYEAKYLAAGRPIHRATWQRAIAPGGLPAD